MTPPRLRRIKVSSEEELRIWLDGSRGAEGEVMIVTCDRSSPRKFVTGAAVRAALAERGWRAGRSYTLGGRLVGHVARPG